MIVGITGRAGSGNDTVASIVQELYPEMNWQIKGFADRLRHVAHLFLGIPALDFKCQETKNQVLGPEWGGITVRTFLQRLGTDAIRDSLHPNAWVNALMCDYIKCLDEFGGSYPKTVIKDAIEEGVELFYPNWLIPDTRFTNELEAITSRGGICIRIIRPDNPYPKSDHISETALDGVELPTIINSGSLEQLRMRVKEVFDPIVKNIGNETVSSGKGHGDV